MMKFSSKSDLDASKQQFSLLLNDDYELVITEVKEETQAKYNAKPDETGKIPQENILRVVLDVVAFKDGGNPVDEDNKFAVGRKVFFTGRTESMGFQRDGTPSKTRSLVAYATGQDVLDELELDDWQVLVGKTVYAEIVQYTTEKGDKRNKIARFLAPPRRRDKKSEDDFLGDIDDSDIPIIN